MIGQFWVPGLYTVPGLCCRGGLLLGHPCVVLRLKCLGPCPVLKILCFSKDLAVCIGSDFLFQCPVHI